MASSSQSPAAGLPAFLKKQTDEIMESFTDLEWAQNQRYQEGRQQPYNATSGAKASRWARMTGDEIAKRNRYGNIDPFHSNRVKLRVRDGENDYINASPIALHTAARSERRYIACQGPTVASATHMWQMIAQHTRDPAVVVMLTQTHEGFREKCWPYFPTDPSHPMHLAGADSSPGSMQGTVTLLSEEYDEACHTTVRTLRLDTRDPTKSESPMKSKTVVHYLFERWPDFGVPEGEDRAALMALIHKTADMSRRPPKNSDSTSKSDSGNSSDTRHNPRVVHCSAGVGRSGTFIALDHLLAELESGAFDHVDDSTDYVAEVVDQLRQQRMMMVQGESQFQFIYHILRDEWLRRAQTENGRL